MLEHTNRLPLSEAEASRQLGACSDDEFVTTLRAVLLRQSARGWLTISQAAEMAGMSVRSFQRRLGQQGKTFTQILDSVRIERAKELLTCSDRSLGDIAADLGYSKPSNFIRAFRRCTAQTPEQFRSNARQQNDGLA